MEGARVVNIPMDLGRIREKTNTKRMHRSIAPSLVEEATRPVQIIKVSGVLLASEELHISDFKVGPEMTGRITICSLGVLGAELVIGDPIHHVVVRKIGGVCGEELLGLGPESWDTLRGVKEVDRETVRDVVVGHVAEDIVVNITEELDLRLDTPVVTVFGESRMLVEQATVPAAHLMVGHLVAVLYVLLLQDLRGLFEEVPVDPFGNVPVLLRYLLCKVLVNKASVDWTHD